MIPLRYIHLVCGFCYVRKTCEGISCYDCPVHQLEQIAKYEAAHPAPPPQEPEDEQEDE